MRISSLHCLINNYKKMKGDGLWNRVRQHKIISGFMAGLLVVVLIGGFYAASFFSKKFFVEDFNAMNKYYKQALFETGQDKRTESITNYDLLVSAFADFQGKYSAHQPFALRSDVQFANDLAKIQAIIAGTKDDVYTGDLKNAHLALENIRPITQEMFRRNGFSMLAVSLVDFHDSMEKVIDGANAKKPTEVIAAYAEANDKLLAVENETNDAEIQAIRNNLEALLKLAQDNNVETMPSKAAELKSSFVKVYLVRG